MPKRALGDVVGSSTPKVYRTIDGDVTIVFDKFTDPKMCRVTIVHDRGVSKDTPRFSFNSVSAYGKGSQLTPTMDLTENGIGKMYKMVRGRKPNSNTIVKEMLSVDHQRNDV